MGKSPYLKDQRLADVIAAIQVMATYRFYKLDFESWADRITGDRGNAERWKCILEDHPEFFRLDAQKLRASLVIRRQHPKRYDVDNFKEISKTEFDGLENKSRVSRSPLRTDETSSLIQTAINLHSRAIAQEQESRWWVILVPAGVGLLGVIIGALI